MKDKTLSTIYLIVIWIFITSIFLCGAISLVTALNTPYSLSGHVYDNVGTPLVGANITFTNMNSSEVICCDSTSGGEYQQDAANFASGYYDGDTIQYYSVYGISTNTTNESINVANGGTLLDIYITIMPVPHLQNNTDYYISYYYIIGVATHWTNMTDAAGRLGESTISMVGVAILILIIFASVGWIITPYLNDKKNN